MDKFTESENFTESRNFTESGNFTESLKDSRSGYETLSELAGNIQKYYLWVIFAVGVPGNIATLITVLKMKPLTSLTSYVAVLSIVDLLAIFVKLSLLVFQVNSVDILNGGCKFMIFLGNFLVCFANWILVAMAAERYVAVWFPFIIGSMWSCRKSLISIGVMCIVLVGTFSHLLFIVESKDGNCLIQEEYIDFVQSWYWINATLYAFLPCASLFVFNIMIICGINRSEMRQRSLFSILRVSNSNHRDVSIMLIVVSVVFLVLTTPRSVLLILSVSHLPQAYQELLSQITFVLCDSNHAINFFLYFLSVRRFRVKAMKLLTCKSYNVDDKGVNLVIMRPSLKHRWSGNTGILLDST